MKKEYGELDFALSERIMREAYIMGVRRVGFYTVGEMFLCKNIQSHIAAAKGIGYEYIYSDTNGILATAPNMEKVIKAGLNSIKFSINAGTRETYKLVHGCDAFEEVIENLKATAKLKNELFPELKILVSYVVTKNNENEIGRLREIVKPYITDEIYVHPIIPGYLRRYGIDCEKLKSEDVPFANISAPCSMVFDRIHVTYDGFLTACCQDFNRDLLLADLNKVSLSEGWKNEKAEALRQAHRQKNLKNWLCAGCVDRGGSYDS